jgi:NAD(P)-dependent dehydrogenase (short-subunit alcohol dehydrogenase family)
VGSQRKGEKQAMEIRFDGKTAVVTGGSKGLGYDCAELLALSGAKVAIIARDQSRLDHAVESIAKKGGVAKGYALDVSQIAQIAPTIEKIRADLGEIDVLVQAAGVMRTQSSQEITEADWDAVFNTNTKAVFFVMQAVTNQSMIPCQKGSIVNIASVAGLKGMCEPLCAAHYCSSKGAVVQLTRQGAIEWAKYKIRVNTMAPGGVASEAIRGIPPDFLAKATKLIPWGRFSEPAEVASGVCYLASDAASMITGQTLIMDGGSYVMGI